MDVEKDLKAYLDMLDANKQAWIDWYKEYSRIHKGNNIRIPTAPRRLK